MGYFKSESVRSNSVNALVLKDGCRIQTGYALNHDLNMSDGGGCDWQLVYCVK